MLSTSWIGSIQGHVLILARCNLAALREAPFMLHTAGFFFSFVALCPYNYPYVPFKTGMGTTLTF
jgi:hypothetical protein